MTGREWHVLLVGGSSGTGKTELVARLTRHYGIGGVDVDDIAGAVRAMTTPATQPDLHRAVAAAADAEPAVDTARAIGRALRPALVAVVDTHLDHGPPVIVEGDFVLPELLDDAPPHWTAVRAVFLHEPDEAQLLANLAAREPEAGLQERRAHTSWLYGWWLRETARRRGLPVVAARPRPDVLDRALAVID